MHYLAVVPEQALIAACIERAISDACGCSSDESHPAVRQGIKRDAIHWLFNWQKKLEYDEWSFPWACEQLRLDPFLVQRRIREFWATKPEFRRVQTDFVGLTWRINDTSATNAEVYYR